jgi:hypothetical protein
MSKADALIYTGFFVLGLLFWQLVALICETVR